MKNAMLKSLIPSLALCFAQLAYSQGDALPSWNDGQAKRSILAFVQRVTNASGPDLIPVVERVAVFDNDGTLWAEKPLPNEIYFVVSRVRELAAKDPSIRERQPFKAAIEEDAAYFHQAGAKAVLELLLATHSEMSQEQFAATARQFLQTERHPKLNRLYTATAYQPMIELLTYLRANGFQTWICSGGTADFMRVFVAQTYGIPPEQTIGSVIKRDSRLRDGRRVVWLLPQIDSVNDKEVKPVNIDRQIGMRPVWLCPLRLRRGQAGTDRPWPGYPLASGTTYVNVGFWGVVNVGPDAPASPRNRAIEAEVSALGGHKSLYSEAFYEPDEFDRLYGGAHLARVKARFDPDDRLTSLYDKVVHRR